jgi:hypothetical protein
MDKKKVFIILVLFSLMTKAVIMPFPNGNPWFDPEQPRDRLGRWAKVAESFEQGAKEPRKLNPRTPSFQDLGIKWSGAWTLEDRSQFLKEVRAISRKVGGADNFRAIFGDMNVTLKITGDGLRSCWAWMTCYNGISLSPDSENYGILSHELGHRVLNENDLRDFEYSIGYYDENGEYVHVSGYNPITKKHERTALGYPHEGYPYEQHPASHSQSKLEDFADMFRAWALDEFSDDEAGEARQEFMDNFMADVVQQVEQPPTEVTP